jgi:ABC-type polysaccharide transport system permease subunit
MPVAQMVVGYILAITGALVLFLTALVSLGIIGSTSPATASAKTDTIDEANRWKQTLKEIAGKISLPTVLGLIILLAGMIMCGGFGCASH